MCWYVFIEDWNKRKIVPFNIFNSVSFKKLFIDLISKNLTFTNFKIALDDILTICFSHKREYEIDTNYNMIDVYEQLILNYDIFADYCYNFYLKGEN